MTRLERCRYDLGDDADPEPRRTRNYRVTVRRILIEEDDIEVSAYSAAEAKSLAKTAELLDFAEWSEVSREIEVVGVR